MVMASRHKQEDQKVLRRVAHADRPVPIICFIAFDTRTVVDLALLTVS
jgi:hypothetical protein